jgi:hypothetical protein
MLSNRLMVSLKKTASYIGTLSILLAILLVCASSSAAELDPEPGTQGDDIPLLNDERERDLDEIHQKTSQLLVSAADWLDSFFDDDRQNLEENTTRANLRLSFGYSRFDDFEFSPRVSLRLKLPKLSKKALLIIGASDDDDFDVGDNPISDDPRNEDNEKSDLSAGLRYFLKIGKSYNFSTTVGISWGYMYAGLRYRYTYDFGPWQGRATDTAKYYTDDGFENKLALAVERHFSRRWFFRTTGTVDWYEGRDGLPHALIFRLYHVLNRHQALQYEVGNYFDTSPNYKMTDLQLRVRYRQRFYRDWLILEVAPQIRFHSDHDREPDPGIIIRLEADLGYLADKDVFKDVFGF